MTVNTSKRVIINTFFSQQKEKISATKFDIANMISNLIELKSISISTKVQLLEVLELLNTNQTHNMTSLEYLELESALFRLKTHKNSS